MSRMEISRQSFKVRDLVGWRDNFLLDPGYQREGGIWTLSRQQLFIDSILNGFDVPPIYLHRLRPPEFRDGRATSYAVVDGRQRIEALEKFATGSLSLSADFVLLEEVEDAQLALIDELADRSGRFARMNLPILRERAPELAYRFLDYAIPVSVVDTEDSALIEELFFRLNEGVPLTPAEKRTRGELLRGQIIPLVQQDDIFKCVGFQNRRRRYEDLLLRLLFLKSEGATAEHIPDMKKTLIDRFAESFRPAFGQQFSSEQEAEMQRRLRLLVDGVRPTLNTMNEIFDESDVLLRQASTFLMYYLVLQTLAEDGEPMPTRDDFVRFNRELESLSGTDESQLSEDQRDALEYVTPLQETTTGSYTQQKVYVLLRYMTGDLHIV